MNNLNNLNFMSKIEILKAKNPNFYLLRHKNTMVKFMEVDTIQYTQLKSYI